MARQTDPTGSGSQAEEEEEEARRQSPADGDSRIPEADEQREEATALRAAGSNLERDMGGAAMSEAERARQARRQQRQSEAAEATVSDADTGQDGTAAVSEQERARQARDEQQRQEENQLGGADPDEVEFGEDARPPTDATGRQLSEREQQARQAGRDAQQTDSGVDGSTEQDGGRSTADPRGESATVKDDMDGSDGAGQTDDVDITIENVEDRTSLIPSGRAQQIEQRVIEERELLRDPSDVEVHLGRTADGRSVFVTEVDDEAVRENFAEQAAAEFEADTGVEADPVEDVEVVEEDGTLRAEPTEEFERDVAAGELEAEIEAQTGRDVERGEEFEVAETIAYDRPDVEGDFTQEELAAAAGRREVFTADLSDEFVADLQRPGREAAQRREDVARANVEAAGVPGAAAAQAAAQRRQEVTQANVEAAGPPGTKAAQDRAQAITERRRDVLQRNIDAADFQRQRATRELESDLEEQVGEDLEVGEGFRVRDTAEGFRAELTEGARERLGDAPSGEESFLDRVLGDLPDEAQETFADVTGGVPGPEREKEFLDTVLGDAGEGLQKREEELREPFPSESEFIGGLRSGAADAAGRIGGVIPDIDARDLSGGLITAGAAGVVTPEPVTTGVGAGAVVVGAGVAGAAAVVSQTEREDLERLVTRRPEFGAGAAIATAAADSDVEEELFPSEVPTAERGEDQFASEIERVEDPSDLFGSDLDIQPSTRELPELLPPEEIREDPRFMPPEFETPEDPQSLSPDELGLPGVETQQLLQRRRQQIEQATDTGTGRERSGTVVPDEFIPDDTVTIGEDVGEEGSGGGLITIVRESPRSMPLEQIETPGGTIRLRPELGQAVAAERAREDQDTLEAGRELDFEAVESGARQTPAPEIAPTAATEPTVSAQQDAINRAEERTLSPVFDRTIPFQDTGVGVDTGVREDTRLDQRQASRVDEIPALDDAVAEPVGPETEGIGVGFGEEFAEPTEQGFAQAVGTQTLNEPRLGFDLDGDETPRVDADDELFSLEFEFDVTADVAAAERQAFGESQNNRTSPEDRFL